MHWMLGVLLAGCASLAVAEDVPEQFRGRWVAQAQDCDPQLGLDVERDRLVLTNGIERGPFQDIDVCHSCVGGSKSDGIEVWLIPEFSRKRYSSFIVHLNADKVPGVTRLKIRDGRVKNASCWTMCR